MSIGWKGPLPWKLIQRQVIAGIREMNPGRFVNTHRIADFIQRYPGKYPYLVDIPRRSTLQRIAKVMKMAGWKSYTNQSKSRRNGKIFIVPWIPEDDIIQQAREEVMPKRSRKQP